MLYLQTACCWKRCCQLSSDPQTCFHVSYPGSNHLDLKKQHSLINSIDQGDQSHFPRLNDFIMAVLIDLSLGRRWKWPDVERCLEAKSKPSRPKSGARFMGMAADQGRQGGLLLQRLTMAHWIWWFYLFFLWFSTAMLLCQRVKQVETDPPVHDPPVHLERWMTKVMKTIDKKWQQTILDVKSFFSKNGVAEVSFL